MVVESFDATNDHLVTNRVHLVCCKDSTDMTHKVDDFVLFRVGDFFEKNRAFFCPHQTTFLRSLYEQMVREGVESLSNESTNLCERRLSSWCGPLSALCSPKFRSPKFRSPEFSLLFAYAASLSRLCLFHLARLHLPFLLCRCFGRLSSYIGGRATRGDLRAFGRWRLLFSEL